MRIAMFTEVFLPKIDGVVTRVLRTLDEFARSSATKCCSSPR